MYERSAVDELIAAGRGFADSSVMYALKPWRNDEPPLPGGRQPHTIEHSFQMASRVPSTLDATEDPMAEPLANSLESASRDLPKFQRNLHVYREYKGFGDITAEEIERDPHTAARKIINRMADNLVWLHDNIRPEIRERAKKWYDGANRIMRNFAKRYGVTDEQSAGVLAVLSPKNDWFANADMARRILDFWQNESGSKWRPEMARYFNANWKGKPSLSEQGPIYQRIRGKAFSELTDVKEQAVWFRLWDQTFNERDFPIISPEGDFLGPVRNKGKKGEPGPVATLGWGNGFNPIEKSFAILADGSREGMLAVFRHSGLPITERVEDGVVRVTLQLES